MEFITIATTANGTDFGDLTVATSMPATTASSTRVVIAGGYSSPDFLSLVNSVEIATIGNAVNFGELTDAREQPAGCSNGHGGLG